MIDNERNDIHSIQYSFRSVYDTNYDTVKGQNGDLQSPSEILRNDEPRLTFNSSCIYYFNTSNSLHFPQFGISAEEVTGYKRRDCNYASKHNTKDFFGRIFGTEEVTQEVTK